MQFHALWFCGVWLVQSAVPKSSLPFTPLCPSFISSRPSRSQNILATTIFFSFYTVSIIFPFLECRIIGIMPYDSRGVRFTW